MTDIREEALQMLADMGETPRLGGLISEEATARLLSYSPAYYRQKAAEGLSPIPWKQIGNRRFYRLNVIIDYLSEDDGI